MPRNPFERPISRSVFVLAEAERIYDEAGLRDAISRGFIRPGSSLPLSVQQKLLKRGLILGKIFLVPMRDPLKRFDDAHELFHGRTLGFELKRTAAQKEGERHVFKGVGNFPRVVNLDFHRLITGTFSEERYDLLEERRFWGGARKDTLQIAVRDLARVRKEFEKAKASGDKVVRFADENGVRGLDLMAPYAMFKPLQVPIGFKHNQRGFANNIERILKVPAAKGLKLLGIKDPRIPPSQRILAYTAPSDADARVSEYSRAIVSGSKMVGMLGAHAVLKKFASSLALMLHILHSRLKKYGSHEQAGSIFHPNNIGVDLKKGEPVFFDFDTINSSRKNFAADFLNSIESIASLGSVYELSPEHTKAAIANLFRIYLHGKSASQRRELADLLMHRDFENLGRAERLFKGGGWEKFIRENIR